MTFFLLSLLPGSLSIDNIRCSDTMLLICQWTKLDCCPPSPWPHQRFNLEWGSEIIRNIMRVGCQECANNDRVNIIPLDWCCVGFIIIFSIYFVRTCCRHFSLLKDSWEILWHFCHSLTEFVHMSKSSPAPMPICQAPASAGHPSAPSPSTPMKEEPRGMDVTSSATPPPKMKLIQVTDKLPALSLIGLGKPQ